MRKKFILFWAAMITSLAIGIRAEVIQSFEKQEAVEKVKVPHKSQKLKACSDFFTDGTTAIKYSIPRWRPGAPDWSNFYIELPSGKRNFTGYKYLALDLINPTRYTEEFILFIADEKQRFNKGYTHKTLRLLPGSHTRIFVKISDIAKKCDPSRLKVLTITQRKPYRDTVLIVDAIQRVKPGDKPFAITGKAAKTLGKLSGASYIDGHPALQSLPLLSSVEPEEDIRYFQLYYLGSRERSRKFATKGKYSLHYKSPKWVAGTNEWRGIQLRNAFNKKNWIGYDWLVFDLVNPTGQQQHTRLLISDTKTKFNRGYVSPGYNLQPYSHQRITIPTSAIAAKVDLADIALTHFIVHKPAADYELYLDNFHLLKPNAVSDPVPEKLRSDILKLNLKHCNFSSKKISKMCDKELKQFPTDSPWRSQAAKKYERITVEAKKYISSLKQKKLTTGEFDAIKLQLSQMPLRIKRVRSEIIFLKAAAKAGLGDGSYGCGFASSMEKVFPKDVPFAAQTQKQINISLARGEKESVQLLIMPNNRKLKNVKVETADFAGNRNIFSAEYIKVEVVGYLKTVTKPPYKVNYIGWWPHLLLNFFDTLDVDPDVAQAFLVRFNCPRAQTPGNYKGQLKLTSDGKTLGMFDVNLQVYNFEMPTLPPIPTAMSCADDMRRKAGKSWNKLKFEFADFLAAHYLEPDGIYRSTGPDFELMKYLKEKNCLSAFNLTNFDHGIKVKSPKKHAELAVKRIRPLYEKAKSLNMLDYAYVYGFDEAPVDKMPFLAACADAFKREFPGLKVATTAHHLSYGPKSPLNGVDIWCPLLNFYDLTQADKARKAGKQVWWYPSSSCNLPFPNIWVENPGIDMRILNGFLTAKFRPDGLLYYAINIWGKNKPLSKHDSFTEWNPVSFASLHGDGCMIYAGPNCKPQSSFPLENMRDGFEDLIYYRLLEKCAQIYRDSNDQQLKKWASEADMLLKIPPKVAKSTSAFTRQPNILYHYRNQIGRHLNKLNKIPFPVNSICIKLKRK